MLKSANWGYYHFEMNYSKESLSIGILAFRKRLANLCRCSIHWIGRGWIDADFNTHITEIMSCNPNATKNIPDFLNPFALWLQTLFDGSEHNTSNRVTINSIWNRLLNLFLNPFFPHMPETTWCENPARSWCSNEISMTFVLPSARPLFLRIKGLVEKKFKAHWLKMYHTWMASISLACVWVYSALGRGQSVSMEKKDWVNISSQGILGKSGKIFAWCRTRRVFPGIELARVCFLCVHQSNGFLASAGPALMV